jgi:hypothetical protein
MHTAVYPRHPSLNRRAFLQAGAIGALGMSMTKVAELRGSTPPSTAAPRGESKPHLLGPRGLAALSAPLRRRALLLALDFGNHPKPVSALLAKPLSTVRLG